MSVPTSNASTVSSANRADQSFSTKPVREKIADYIRDADIVVADCTGNNPNVLYELGIAHAMDTDVVLITQDAMDQVPSDIRLFEFIKYDLGYHREFLTKLDAAISDLLVARYDRLFETAGRLFTRYQREANPVARRVTKDAFVVKVKAAEDSEEMPTEEDTLAFAEFVLAAIVENGGDVDVMSTINPWLLRSP